MKPVTTYSALCAIAVGCAFVSSQGEQAQETFVNSERITSSLTAHGETMSPFRTGERTLTASSSSASR